MLSIFRLHGPRCSAKKPKHDRVYRRCSCPIHVEGKCGDRFLRQSLHTTNWQRAQKLIVEAEARGSWDPLPAEAQAAPITIAEATARFLKDAETGRRLSEATLRKYRLMLGHLEKFAAKKGFLYLKQLDLNALREFRESWDLGPRTAMKKLERVKAFFRFASENEWVAANPARLLRGPANIRDTQKLPFEPAEIERIFKAAAKFRFRVARMMNFWRSRWSCDIPDSGSAMRPCEPSNASKATICISTRRRAALMSSSRCRRS